ncbi:hypothetical protein LG201_08310 [Methylobacillus gramineus]|uniref:hypothetical protein n=1 Tax=Methylobacillus gramineus TaxID=755169 RepID=UPI001CFFF3A4|nr:hypothetical protein [Methylobacillus gramineus]MCB5185206.1 hypothetical protein [Methylobacillus gramineus]
MSAQEYDFPKTTKKEFILAVLGGLFAPVLVLFLVARLFFGIQASHIDDPEVKQPTAAEAAKPAEDGEADEDAADAEAPVAEEPAAAEGEKSE